MAKFALENVMKRNDAENLTWLSSITVERKDVIKVFYLHNYTCDYCSNHTVWGKILAHSANLIAASKAPFINEKFGSL